MTNLKARKTTRAKITKAPKAPAQRAKVFWTGRSQAVRLPKEFRFVGDEVKIYRKRSAAKTSAAPPTPDNRRVWHRVS